MLYELSEDHQIIIEALHKELEVSQDKIATFIFEMGVGSLVAARMGIGDDNKFQEVIDALRGHIEKNEFISKIADSMYKNWKNGEILKK